MDVSVIICTRNRPEQLERCLASITADRSAAEAEVIVIDNGSTDRTGRVIRDAMEASPRRMLMLWSPVPGHARARNIGVLGATGSVLAFTDDDVTVEPGWIDAMHRAFNNPAVVAVGGRIIPTFAGDRPSWMTDPVFFGPITLWDYGTEPFQMSRDRYPIGANMAFRRAILTGSEPFDPRFGHTGRASFGFEETNVFDRLFETSIVMYEPHAVVNHWLDADLLLFDAVRSKMFQFGIGEARFRDSCNPLPPYSRRVVRASRAARRAVLAHRRNQRNRGDTAAFEELHAVRDAGIHMGTLLASQRRLSEWLALRV